MSKTLVVLFLFSFQLVLGQQDNSTKNKFTVELFSGFTSEANEGFPDRNLQIGGSLSIGTYQGLNRAEWSYWLGGASSGLSLSYQNLGNNELIGSAFALMPYFEIPIFNKGRENKKLWLNAGFGFSYINKKFDTDTNFFNKAISTNINWAYRTSLSYQLYRTNNMHLKTAIGYFHHSNGHTRLPNQGLNSFLVSVTSDFYGNSKQQDIQQDTPTPLSSKYQFISVRTGLGINTFSTLVANDQKPVYAFAASYGFVKNNTFKFEFGAYYRFYKQYHDFIKSDDELVAERFAFFKEKPGLNASNYGLFAGAGLLLGHIGADLQLGLNIHKPFYQVDWLINEGEGIYQSSFHRLGELDWYYEIKRTVMSRMGLTAYLINTKKNPKHNVYLSAHLNANLGQADFSELSLGYVKRLD
ncbi:acyloxyacyl hydrolase [Spongiivirga citrea]|uniref:Deacylase n=1 Tax=Spongiivirga citrea TaxID=1481457 RepID=A0A6M0CP51_9FLAO|nr:acyloxyacyl hydrolase [Spongiivirga citrea]NER15710.1 deacylase [Spongiivirga citrea]